MQIIRLRESWAFFVAFGIGLSLSAANLYRHPIYAMDSVQYMGNALLMDTTDISAVHERVYSELNRRVPSNILPRLLGTDPTAPPDQNLSRRERARNSLIFAEFLPLFAIRPLYNQSIWLLTKTGLDLLTAVIVLSVGSYFLMGILLFGWIRPYAGSAFSSVFAFLVMISPPLREVGRELTSDPAATLVAFASLYFLFEKRRFLPGFILLLVSVFFRTDFVVLAAPVFLACWLQKKIDFWKACALGLLAVGSVLLIGHFSGDYGTRMLYYRNFISVPVDPAEMHVQFTLHDYLSAFRDNFSLTAESFLIPSVVLGILGLFQPRTRVLFLVTLAYIILHYLALPRWQERWAALFYLSCAVCAASLLQKWHSSEKSSFPVSQGEVVKSEV